MDSNGQQLIEHESIREPAFVNKLIIKMRNRAVKRPKCRSKFIIMASGASVLLFVIGLFILFTECPSEKIDTFYGSEYCRTAKFILMFISTDPSQFMAIFLSTGPIAKFLI